MPSGKKGKNLGSKSQTTRESTNPVTQGTGKKSIDDSATHGTRSGLRSRPSAESAWPVRDNPESILRKPRKPRKATETAQAQDRPESPTRRQLHSLAKSIETSLEEEYWRVDNGTPEECFAEETPLSSQDTDPEQTFNRKWGYLPPLGEEALAVIDAIIADPGLAKEYSRMKPEDPAFREGLRFRNILLEKSLDLDPYVAHIWSLAPAESAPETNEERELHEQLWTSDQVKCSEQSNEALFQRTLMMSLVARHLFIYDRDATNKSCLDFSVEETWSCPPMPTRAYPKNDKYLTQPKPDLAVCFRREALIPDDLWSAFPKATMRLACYEHAVDATERLFHFFTIEAKKAHISADDNVGKRQSLNNASQALHNMFEFFRDAGPQHQDDFFTKVRFFSVVASTEGLTIRIHRATRDAAGWALIIKNRPEYPLKFKYREFFTIQRKDFGRETVLETFKKILIGYGANELRPLLHKAAAAIMEKLKCDPEGEELRQDRDFYRYGQTSIAPGSGRHTPAASRDQSVQSNMLSRIPQSGMTMEAPSRDRSQTNRSIDMLRSGTVTPTQALNDKRKRTRRQSNDSVRARSTRQRNQ
ncbi:MAG: hypothetical protein M1830_010745 [Pleopsidium flavum]|nr:MAG: hypothetical protein M1830_010745 [Pleopsidium flavum]